MWNSTTSSTGPHPALMRVVWAMSLWAFVLGGCSSDDEPEQELQAEDEAPADDEESEAEEEERLSEAFGLPVPDDHYNVQWEQGRIEVTTHKSLEEVRQFFDDRLVDYEIVDEEWRFELVPLRSGDPLVAARYAARPERSPVRIDYRQDGSMGADEADEVAEVDDEAAAEDRPRPTDPEWMEEHRGQPVEIRTDDGELLAPEARWGEPYTPPEGSPMDTEMNRPNFGRPFGEWSGM